MIWETTWQFDYKQNNVYMKRSCKFFIRDHENSLITNPKNYLKMTSNSKMCF